MRHRYNIGSIAALYVDKEYRGRGLGALVAKAITRQIAELGQDVCAHVFEENKTPQALFEKLGFRRAIYCY